ncbi:hypothetical protein PI86_07620 [Burkholderia sp. A9]|uniref:hypothetical protein n=1 Tax=Burkholderia sp. A9 TaxID=1365108 RepID=UPI000574BE67|nr:hypothetical protein [Burkholderia sp. A9]KHK59678.1 hypothetical protein PI86_07620 [Burkholderia sp. A9]
MKRLTLTRARAVVAVVATAGMVGASGGWAQAPQKNTISFSVPAANTKYTQQHALDVGDMPGHQIRIFENHRTFPNDPPAFAGVRVRDFVTRAATDLVDNDGRVSGYVVFILANGDNVFGRLEGTTRASVGQSGGRRTAMVNIVLTGGTGKFQGIRGTLQQSSVAEPSKGYNESKFEGVYWME